MVILLGDVAAGSNRLCLVQGSSAVSGQDSGELGFSPRSLRLSNRTQLPEHLPVPSSPSIRAGSIWEGS